MDIGQKIAFSFCFNLKLPLEFYVSFKFPIFFSLFDGAFTQDQREPFTEYGIE